MTGLKFVAMFALAAAGVVKAADAPTTSLFLVGFDQQPLVASVVTSDATATTFSIACAPAATNCDVPESFTFTQGPSTMHYEYTHTPTAPADPAGTVEVGCSITADHGTCSRSLNAALVSITSTATTAQTTFSNGGSELGGQVVTITAGNLVVPTTASSTAASTTSSSAHLTSSISSNASVISTSSFANVTSSTALFSNSTLAVSTTSASVTTTSSKASAKTTTTHSSSSSTGGMPMITGNAQWVVGGVAAALMAVAL